MATDVKRTINDLVYFIQSKKEEKENLVIQFKFHELDDEISLQVLSEGKSSKIILGKAIPVGKISDQNIISDFMDYLLNGSVFVENYRKNNNGSHVAELVISKTTQLKCNKITLKVEANANIVYRLYNEMKNKVHNLPDDRKSYQIKKAEYEEELDNKPEQDINDLIIKKLSLSQKKNILKCI